MHREQKFNLKFTLEKNSEDVVLSQEIQKLIFAEQQSTTDKQQLSKRIDQQVKIQHTCS